MPPRRGRGTAEVCGPLTGVQLRRVVFQASAAHGGAIAARMRRAASDHRGVADERADEHQAADELGPAGRRQAAAPAAMELPTTTAGAPSS